MRQLTSVFYVSQPLQPPTSTHINLRHLDYIDLIQHMSIYVKLQSTLPTHINLRQPTSTYAEPQPSLATHINLHQPSTYIDLRRPTASYVIPYHRPSTHIKHHTASAATHLNILQSSNQTTSVIMSPHRQCQA